MYTNSVYIDVSKEQLTLSHVQRKQTLFLLLDGEANLRVCRVVEGEASLDFLVDAAVAELESTLRHTRQNGFTR